MAIIKISARRLLLEADEAMRQGGLNPLTDCITILDAWLLARPIHYAQLAVAIGKPPPDAVTVQAFLDLLRERCERRYPGYLAAREDPVIEVSA
jgi:hypothetical protein